MTDRFTEVKVGTKAQTYVLTELHETHARIRSMLGKIEHEAHRALESGHFDTPFLLNPCHELAVLVAEERALKQAAYWAGSSREEIASVRIAGHVIVEAPHEGVDAHLYQGGPA